MPEQRVEWRLIDNKGTRWPMGSDLLRTPGAIRKSWDAVYPDRAPHRIERRTVTTTEWETAENGGDDAADLIERTAKENT